MIPAVKPCGYSILRVGAKRVLPISKGLRAPNRYCMRKLILSVRKDPGTGLSGVRIYPDTGMPILDPATGMPVSESPEIRNEKFDKVPSKIIYSIQKQA